MGSRIKDQIDVQLMGSLNSGVHHSNLIRLKRVLSKKESAFCVTGNGVCLEDSLFLVILCVEASQVYTKMRQLLHLLGDFTLVYLGSEKDIWRRFIHVMVLSRRSMPPPKFQL